MAASSFTITLPDHYNWVILTSVILCMECLLTSLFVVVKARMKYFTLPFMEQFETLHKSNIGEGSAPAPGGYPDMGNGLYADKLPYHHWYRLNLAMRVHQNFVE